MRQTATFPLDDLVFWKKQLLHWAAGHELSVYLDSNGAGSTAFTPFRPRAFMPAPPLYPAINGRDRDGMNAVLPGWECLVAAGAVSILEANAGQAFRSLQASKIDKDWLFGFFGYDLKNETERLTSSHFDGIGLPDMGFFQPETVAGIRNDQIEIQTIGRLPEEVFEEIRAIKPGSFNDLKSRNEKIELRPRIAKGAYLQKVEAIRRHIAEGDLYEMNLCQELYAENTGLDPVAVFEKLNAIGKAPFSTCMRWRDRWLLSASPERFLKKEGPKVISQPIKGTRRRSLEDDKQLREELFNSEKDRAENVMIVDLVRNDLARNCIPGSVRVEELFGIYTFETVHQMISTVSGLLPIGSIGSIKPIDSNQSIHDAFPPGSMTGAPKVMAMELIEQYEHTRRGLYSGAVGYFDPNGDFDFNVVIRSILYNAADRYISVQVGGAIVFDSVPEQEYEECLLKAEAMIRALREA